MPVVLRSGPYRFLFYSNENNEPPHIHIRRESLIAKFWLSPVQLAENDGFASHEVWKIEQLVQQHRDQLEEAWHDYFGR